jgi:hypothetical protein
MKLQKKDKVIAVTMTDDDRILTDSNIFSRSFFVAVNGKLPTNIFFALNSIVRKMGSNEVLSFLGMYLTAASANGQQILYLRSPTKSGQGRRERVTFSTGEG